MIRKLICLAMITLMSAVALSAKSTREERKLITAGNTLYKEGKISQAAKEYEKALSANPESREARFNLGLSQIKLSAKAGNDTTQMQKLRQSASENLLSVGRNAAIDKPALASRAFYNLGNMAFNSGDYQQALDLYKQSLRLNPDDDDARRNLRITQKKLNNQDQNKDNKQNKDQDKQNEDQQNKDQQHKPQDNQQNEDKQDKRDQQQQNISPQTAEQILKAMENKEAETRARIQGASGGDKSRNNQNSSRKNW